MKNLPEEKQSTEQPSALKIAERLFERFSYMYGNKFLDMWANVDHDKLIETWSDEISGYSLEELKRGVDSCKTREWPPTMPEFLKLCRPPINHESAFREAQLNIVKIERNEQPEWSSRAVYWAKVQFGHFDLKNSNYQQAKKRWDSMLDELLEDERDHGLPEIPNI